MKKYLLNVSFFLLVGLSAMAQNEERLLMVKKKAQDSVAVTKGQYIGVRNNSGLTYEGLYQGGAGQNIQVGINTLSLDEVQKISTLEPSLTQNKGPLLMIFGILGTAVGAGAFAVGVSNSERIRPTEMILGASTMAVGITFTTKGVGAISSRSYPRSNWNYSLY